MTNTAPILDASGNPALVAIAEDIATGSNLGTRVVDLIDPLITDSDGDFGAIAITSLNSQNGSWQYSVNGGTSWTTLTNISATNAVVLGTIGLYTPGVGGTPEPTDQDWLTFTSFPASSTQSVDATGITLNTTAALIPNQNYAGFSNYTTNQTLQNPKFPTLDRAQGFQIAFEAQVIENMFTNVDRTVFNLIVVSSDGTRAIELGFQRTGNGQGRIFAQSDDVTDNPGGQPETLFTSAEEVSFNTTQFARYSLEVSGSTYTLRANGTAILSGPLRDYSNFIPPLGAANPYNVPNFLFLGDNTTSAGGTFKLGRVAVQTETRIRFVPNLNFAGNASFTFRAWDGSDGTAPGGRVNTVINGGQTPFSTASETATIQVISDPSDDITFYNFSAARYQVAEGNAARTEPAVVLTRTGNTAIASSVTVALSPGNPNPATAGRDYGTNTVSLNFAAGETQKIVSIRVLGDRLFEADESIALALTGLSANSRRGSSRPTATLILRNDDPLNRTGTVGNDILRGDNTRNILNGLGGNDGLIGLGANDTLLGGTGNDQLNGGLGADTQTGGTGGDRFLLSGTSRLAAHSTSLVTAPDRITDFRFSQGDRIQLDYDNRLSTSDRPVALFNAGNQTAPSLTVAARGAFADKNQTANGRQALQAREAVFFRWQNQTFLAVNDTQAAFAPNRDLLINITGIQFRAGDAIAGVLSVGSYFA